MESHNRPLVDFVQDLHHAYPGDGVIHVGTGAGTGGMHCWRSWGITNALLIDANPERSAWAESETAAKAGWHYAQAVIAGSEGNATYYDASNPAESGLVDPELLTPIWPGLHRLDAKTIPTVSLTNLFAQRGYSWIPQWLLVDCLPAAGILEGAAPLAAQCSFIWVRAILDVSIPGAIQASLGEITRILEPQGFCLRSIEAGINPTIGEAVFVRDWKGSLTERISRLHNQIAEINQYRERLADQSTTLASETAALKASCREKESRLQTTEAQLAAALQATQKEKEQATELRSQATLAAERLRQSESLQKENATLTAKAMELEKRITVLETENTNLSKALDEQAKLAAEQKGKIEQMEKIAAEKTRRIQELESEASETARRQQMFHEEMVRAEAQIDLIKDVLLREPGI